MKVPFLNSWYKLLIEWRILGHICYAWVDVGLADRPAGWVKRKDIKWIKSQVEMFTLSVEKQCFLKNNRSKFLV
jgi:hypothetical protein